MQQLENKYLLALLVKAYNRPIKDYFYFPEVILLDKGRMEKEDFDFLLAEGFLKEYKHDSFGRFYKLSKKAEDLLYTALVVKNAKKKQLSIPARQAYLHFA